ncbi:hypothetical protein [Erythrobacter neustonensis]|uniref:hypothetical protein n=1 Tax=Erythrobacter neustonensis TaxID=1112 RepID=UPI000AEE2A36|nr:hypothetical protein [Erythrobacter neustonensis]
MTDYEDVTMQGPRRPICRDCPILKKSALAALYPGKTVTGIGHRHHANRPVLP